MEDEYKMKYLKYKAKYLNLKKQLYGGGFKQIWDDLESKITSEHMSQLNDTVLTFVPDFKSHPLTNTIEGIKAAFAILNTDKFIKEFKGVNKRELQPSWYKDNPEIIMIHSNESYFKQFSELMNKIESKDIKVMSGGGRGYDDDDDDDDDSESISLSGRAWNGAKLAATGTALIALSPLLLVAGIRSLFITSKKQHEKNKKRGLY